MKKQAYLETTIIKNAVYQVRVIIVIPGGPPHDFVYNAKSMGEKGKKRFYHRLNIYLKDVDNLTIEDVKKSIDILEEIYEKDSHYTPKHT